MTHTITSSFGTVIRLSESINGSAIAAAVEAPNGKNKEREINDLLYQYFPNCMDVDFGDDSCPISVPYQWWYRRIDGCCEQTRSDAWLATIFQGFLSCLFG